MLEPACSWQIVANEEVEAGPGTDSSEEKKHNPTQLENRRVASLFLSLDHSVPSSVEGSKTELRSNTPQALAA